MPSKFNVWLSTQAIHQLLDLFRIYYNQGLGHVITDLEQMAYRFLQDRADQGHFEPVEQYYFMSFRVQYPSGIVGYLKVSYDLQGHLVRVLSYENTP